MDITDKGVDYPRVKGFPHITGHWRIISIKGGLKIIKYEGQANLGGRLSQWFVNRMRVYKTRISTSSIFIYPTDYQLKNLYLEWTNHWHQVPVNYLEYKNVNEQRVNDDFLITECWCLLRMKS